MFLWVITLSVLVCGELSDQCVNCLPVVSGAQHSTSDSSAVKCSPERNPLVGTRCCATQFGDSSIAECETNSCAANFGGRDHVCANYGSNTHEKFESCPYALSDRAICDVSFYLLQNNGRNCRESSNGYCLGKVKCNTDGVVMPSDQHSNGTAHGGGGSCASSSWGFEAGETCFYDGKSENWKVCSQAKRILLSSSRLPTSHKPTISPSTRPTKKLSAAPTRRPTKLPTARPTSRQPTPASGELDSEVLYGWPGWNLGNSNDGGRMPTVKSLVPRSATRDVAEPTPPHTTETEPPTEPPTTESPTTSFSPSPSPSVPVPSPSPSF